MPAPAQVFPFAFDRFARVILPIIGVRPATARVIVDDDLLRVEFGRFRLRTPRDNIAGAAVTGPYLWIKVIGAHLSLADRGVTFGTNRDAGVCVRFHEPVAALAGIRHPGATVTVTDPAALVEALSVSPGRRR